MVNLSNRWAHEHLDDLQAAFFNGIGFESWENVWGIWNELTPRDAESLRRISAIDRAFASQLITAAWEPHTPTRNYGVFASKWPTDTQTLWTLVNRNAFDVEGGQLRLPAQKGAHYYDLWHGVELQPRTEDDAVILDFAMESHGYGAILETTQSISELSPATQQLLARMKTLAEKPLEEFSNHWESMPQALVAIDKTEAAAKQPEGMVRIPAADFTFRVNGIEIEGMDDEGVDVQYPWENSARRYHEHHMHIDSFWIDRYPVTNAQFKQFLDATHYHPADDHNFLKDWVNGSYPAGWENKPVTWVSIEDARAYSKWAGKRLPHEWEWQYAAQGTDSRRYPWGNFEGPATPLPPIQAPATVPAAPAAPPGPPTSTPTPAPEKGPAHPKLSGKPQSSRKPISQPNPPATDKPTSSEACPTCPPVVAESTPDADRGREALPPSDVEIHPRGASPFGVLDLTGNVWQWTDEYADAHTRFAILRGGSHYQPQGSRWYFPQAYELSQHGKYLLMAPSLDRSATVGFRCAKDAAK
jgi:formylglycine-generating enzyme required for sulfatase activity